MADTVEDLRREIALLRAAQAPVIYCTGILSPGIGGGVGNVTLTCSMSVGLGGSILSDNTPVAQLRFPMSVIPLLRQALDQIELLAKPAASGEKN